MQFRVGLGHDTHRLGGHGPIVLGGVVIPYDFGALGHSDADVLLHAITDALLGAAGLGDIGQWFPDTDPANKGKDSAEMLATVWAAVRQKGWRLANLDVVVFAQRLKVAPHRDAIRRRVAETLDVEPDRVSVKGKTGEGVGPIGREEAVAAECVALLIRDDDA
ncbi:MAG: 2-C-methyl-D-erythritol 2,4-cyclodiphosphate synthase [Thermogutta sp.]